MHPNMFKGRGGTPEVLPPFVQPDSLVHMAGTAMFKYLVKYRFYLTWVLGVTPEEQATVAGLSMLCNVGYCLLIIWGFRILPRNLMLIMGLATVYIGPSLVLVFLGCIGGLLVLFALYPLHSVVTIWIAYFLTSSLAQAIGLFLGLDVDGDGDVDWVDFIALLAKTRIGAACGMAKMHRRLNGRTEDVAEKISKRIDRLEHDTLSRLSLGFAQGSGGAGSGGSTPRSVTSKSPVPGIGSLSPAKAVRKPWDSGTSPASHRHDKPPSGRSSPTDRGLQSPTRTRRVSQTKTLGAGQQAASQSEHASEERL